MTRTTTVPDGAPCWIDLTTSDPQKAREFYTSLFGWTAEEPDPAHGGYFNFRKDGVRIAGCMGRMPGQEGPDAWAVHLRTADVRRTLQAAAAHGAQVVVDAMDVDELGTMSAIIDPSGALVGAWQPGTHAGFGIAYESDSPAWFELHTRDYQAALDFYRTVFGWKTVTASDDQQLRYTVLQPEETQLAGVMEDQGAPASYWLVYFGVADADAAAARTRELGGSIVMPPQDTPYGRLASAKDPSGAVFNLTQTTAPASTSAEATAVGTNA